METSALNTFIFGYPKPDPALLLREAVHRNSNDLELVLGLLSAHSRRTSHDQTREVLDDVIERVTMIARARQIMQQGDIGLCRALSALCEGLQAQAEPRGIAFFYNVGESLGYCRADEIRIMTLIVNELATNAIKHAFRDGASGRMTLSARRDRYGDRHIVIDDDGLPFAADFGQRDGGLGLVQQLAASIGASIDFPAAPDKAFKVLLPAPRA